MRTCLGIFLGLIFLISSSFFIFVLNLDKTIYNAQFDKQTISSSGLYQGIPDTIVSMVSNGEITAENQELSPATKEILIDTIKTVLTPDVLKRHSESIIDQTLSNKNVVTEDLSDINNAVNDKLNKNFSELMGIAVSANPDNTFVPKSITFDKSQNRFGQSVIYHKKAIWISLVIVLIFLILLFFASADNYKSRFKWVGGFFIAAAVFALMNFVVFRVVGFDWIVKSISTSTQENLVNNISGQLIQLLSIIKNKFSLLYLYEFAALAILTVVFFILSAVIPAKQVVAFPTSPAKTQENKPKETINAPKNT